MIHLRPRHFVLLAALLVASTTMLLLAGCQSSSSQMALPPPPSIGNPPTSGTTSPAIAPAFPPIPAILPKPAILGPVYPAIVPVSWQRTEPSIRVAITQPQPTAPRLDPRFYRGRVEVVRLPTGEYVGLNVLPIEDYLAGVLSRELYGSWQPAAYRAQAIAARTYALYQMRTFGLTHAWDVTGTQNSQVYGGMRAETPRAWAAVRATWGEVMFAHQGTLRGIFCAFYSACTGGATQTPSDAWGDENAPTLTARIVGPVDADCSKYSWPPMTISKALVTQAVTLWGKKNSLLYLSELGPISTVQITQRNDITNRPTVVTFTDIYGHQGAMRAEEFRLALVTDPNRNVPAPPSSNFDIRNTPDSIVLYNGHGFGHGIGLSQWGAQEFALKGLSARYILNFYYPTETIHKLW